METIHLACATDQGYLPHVATLFVSLRKANPNQAFCLHVFHDETVVTENLARLQGMPHEPHHQLSTRLVSATQVAGLKRNERLPGVIWYRLLLPDLLPDLARVLYLDADTLVLESLKPLWETSLGDAPLAAVTNPFDGKYRDYPEQLGLSDVRSYFNSGVLLMNLAAMRSSNFMQRVLTLSRERPEILQWPDQDALNLVAAGQWHVLHPRWNCMSALFRGHSDEILDRAYPGDTWREAMQQPAILHFEGLKADKPWHFSCRHPKREQYYQLRAQTPWPDIQWEGKTLTRRIGRLLPDWLRHALNTLRKPFRRSHHPSDE